MRLSDKNHAKYEADLRRFLFGFMASFSAFVAIWGGVRIYLLAVGSGMPSFESIAATQPAMHEWLYSQALGFLVPFTGLALINIVLLELVWKARKILKHTHSGLQE